VQQILIDIIYNIGLSLDMMESVFACAPLPLGTTYSKKQLAKNV